MYKVTVFELLTQQDDEPHQSYSFSILNATFDIFQSYAFQPTTRR